MLEVGREGKGCRSGWFGYAGGLEGDESAEESDRRRL
jgi:hypothetical protein